MGLQVMYSRLETEFPREPQAWDLRARRWLSERHASMGTAAMEAAEAVYQEGVAATGGPLMYDLYLAFLREQLEAYLQASRVDPEDHPGKLRGHAKTLAKQILQVNSYQAPVLDAWLLCATGPRLALWMSQACCHSYNPGEPVMSIVLRRQKQGF